MRVAGIYSPHVDRVAQLVEQLAFNQLVRGSSPRAVTIFFFKLY